jgi:RHS repeat-associated protein
LEGRHFYAANDLFSVQALVDGAGAVVERYRYDAYGRMTVLAPDGVTVRPQSSFGNPVGFTGRRLDPESGLWQYRNRYYDAGLGRFITRDPLELRGDALNLYEYVNGRPLLWVDPWGLDDLSPTNECACWELVWQEMNKGGPGRTDLPTPTAKVSPVTNGTPGVPPKNTDEKKANLPVKPHTIIGPQPIQGNLCPTEDWACSVKWPGSKVGGRRFGTVSDESFLPGTGKPKIEAAAPEQVGVGTDAAGKPLNRRCGRRVSATLSKGTKKIIAQLWVNGELCQELTISGW